MWEGRVHGSGRPGEEAFHWKGLRRADGGADEGGSNE